MANEAHKIKLLVLWDILCKNTDESHALNTDEISELLALRGLNVSRKILVQDIATLCDNGYEVLSYKKKYHYYYVVNRSLEMAEVVILRCRFRLPKQRIRPRCRYDDDMSRIRFKTFFRKSIKRFNQRDRLLFV